MKAIDRLRESLQAMLDKTEDKQGIQDIGAMSSLIDEVVSEHDKLATEHTELLKDYKELIKHTSFQPTGQESNETSEPKEVTFESFLSVKPNVEN